jgi:hypothetical protein
MLVRVGVTLDAIPVFMRADVDDARLLPAAPQLLRRRS